MNWTYTPPSKGKVTTVPLDKELWDELEAVITQIHKDLPKTRIVIEQSGTNERIVHIRRAPLNPDES